jgi:hypothetical protein
MGEPTRNTRKMWHSALCCIALLCGVFVRLYLALFLAGGPSLPSLYVSLHHRVLGSEAKKKSLRAAGHIDTDCICQHGQTCILWYSYEPSKF